MLILGLIQSENHEHYNSALKYSVIPVATGLLYLKLRWSLSSCDLLRWNLWWFNTTMPKMKLKFPEFPLLPTSRLALMKTEIWMWFGKLKWVQIAIPLWRPSWIEVMSDSYGDATRLLLVFALSLETDAEIPVDCCLVSFYNESESEVTQLCPILCDPMDCSPPGSSVHRIFQARILEWVSISFSRGSSWPGDQTWVSHIVGRCFTIWATREALFCNTPCLVFSLFLSLPINSSSTIRLRAKASTHKCIISPLESLSHKTGNRKAGEQKPLHHLFPLADLYFPSFVHIVIRCGSYTKLLVYNHTNFDSLTDTSQSYLANVNFP